MPKTMGQWKTIAYQNIDSRKTQVPSILKGDGGWELHNAMTQGNIMQYTLSNAKIQVPYPEEDDYIETRNYFYSTVKTTFGPAYRYVAKAAGGAIQFKGKGRWSGNPEGLGKDLGIKLMDVSFGHTVGSCMSNEDIAKILNKNFIGLIYKLNDGFIEVDWAKTITELKNIIKIKKIIKEELKSALQENISSLEAIKAAIEKVKGRTGAIYYATDGSGLSQFGGINADGFIRDSSSRFDKEKISDIIEIRINDPSKGFNDIVFWKR